MSTNKKNEALYLFDIFLESESDLGTTNISIENILCLLGGLQKSNQISKLTLRKILNAVYKSSKESSSSKKALSLLTALNQHDISFCLTDATK